ncbi:DNA-binding protein RFX5-like [Acipenser ruthenus]|uniref:DNA-binding protein RFX5-like n=1 Tax=Acipenser ruthenus TaxID=7906 RepID=UPI00145AA48C|nr:DNA-binding protein RFX5-like [Acipenser ruthenus]XP_058862159.1 DNA-binding protein RFX5-like [Acipenser ruthenus]
MAEDGPRLVTSKRVVLTSEEEEETEPNTLLQKLKSNISKNIQTKVDSILQDVQRFSDNDKLFLYLQLPSGPSAGDKSSDLSAFNNADQLHACSWIRSHLEEHTDTCLPKQDVYESYKRYCDNLQYRALSAANFGKIIRDVFPNIKARRLGGRGQSKYCYSGIRRKTVLNMPLLPSLDLKNDPSELTELVQTYNSEVTEAACSLICDWAERILKRSFDTVVEIARFLIQEHIVNPRSSTAHIIMSASLAGGPAKPHKIMKKTLQPPPGSGAKGEESSPAAQREKESGERSTAGKQLPSEKGPKSSDSPRAGGRDSQVEAVMKRYPQLLPRGPVLQETCCLRTSPPNITMAAAPLTQQQGALPVFNMILPPLSYPAPAAPSKERASIFRSRGAPKRPAEPPSGDTPKRKRGRPRKARPEDVEPPPRGVIQRAAPGGQASEAIEAVIKHEPSADLASLKSQPPPSLASPETQPPPSRASPKTQPPPSRPSADLASLKSQPPPSLASPETQPPPSRASPETQPPPSRASPETPPFPSRASPETQPLPSRASPETQPLPSLASPETQPLPSRASPETQPLPSRASPETQPLPSRASLEILPSTSLTAQGMPREAPRGNPADQACQSWEEGRGLVEVIRRAPAYAPQVAGPGPEVGEAVKSTEKPADISPSSSRAESQPASQSPRQSGTGERGSEPQSPASHPDPPPSSQTPNQG